MASTVINENTVAESLKIILVKKNLNIARLSEMLGVTSTTMYSKFKRNSFSLKDLDNISKVLNLKYEVPFTIIDNENKL